MRGVKDGETEKKEQAMPDEDKKDNTIENIKKDNLLDNSKKLKDLDILFKKIENDN